MAKQTNSQRSKNGKGKKYWNNKAKSDARKHNYQDAEVDRIKADNNTPVPCKSSDNDPSWYIPNGVMLKDVSTVNFFTPTGKPFILNENEQSGVQQSTITDPGILVMNFMPTVGSANSPTDPINVAMNTSFQAVRNKTSGTSYYEAPDLMLVEVAIGSAYGFYSWMTRLYGIANSFEILNQYTPQALVTALGVNFTDLQKNLANFRTYVNQFAYSLAQFAVPMNFDFIKKNIFMNENVYMDASSKRSQYYMYSQLAFWQYSDVPVENAAGDTVGSLQIKFLRSNTGTQLNVSDIINYGNELLAPLFQSDDMRYMMADVLKAYGEGGLFKAIPIDETYKVIPVYNAEVLSQIENATILPAFPSNINNANLQWRVSQTTGIDNSYLQTFYSYVTGAYAQQLGSDAEWTSAQVIGAINSFYSRKSGLINFHGVDSPTPEQVMVATRLMLINSVTAEVSNLLPKLTITDCATEVIVGASIWLWAKTPNGYELQQAPLSALNQVTKSNIQAEFNKAALLAKFDWHPQISWMMRDAVGTGTTVSDIAYDFDVITTISANMLKNMNYTALMGLFVKGIE